MSNTRAIAGCLVFLFCLVGCASTGTDGKPSYRQFRYEMGIGEANEIYSGEEICRFRQRHFQDTYSRETDQWKDTLDKIDALMLLKYKWPKGVFMKVRARQLQKDMTPIQAYCSVGFPVSVRTGLKRGPEWSQATLRAGSYLFFQNNRLRYWDL